MKARKAPKLISSAALVVEQDRSNECEEPDEKNAVDGRMPLLVEMRKDAARQHLISSHGKKQARDAGLCGEPRTDIGEDEDNGHRPEEQAAAHDAVTSINAVSTFCSP